MTDRTPEPQTADLVKRLRNGFDNIPTVLEWEAADAIEELTAQLRIVLAVATGPVCTCWSDAGIKEIARLLAKYGAYNG